MSSSNSLRLVPTRSPMPPTVGEYLTQWLRGKRSLKPSTQLSYAGHVDRYLVPELGTMHLADLTPTHVDEAYRAITATNPSLSNSTMHRIHATLMSALNRAVQRGLIDLNPAATVELPRPERVVMRTWSPEQFAKFLAVNRNDDLILLYRLMGLLGLRRGEALGLTWGDFDPRSRELRIERTLGRVGAELVLGPPKSAAGRRTLAVDPQTSKAIEEHRRNHGARQNISLGWIFASGDEPLDPAHVSRRFGRLTAEAELPRIRLHDLRHTSASIGLAAGESLIEVSRRLGHSSITVTADIYSHISPALSHSAAERLAQQVIPAIS